jgi:hypothetical protein
MAAGLFTSGFSHSLESCLKHPNGTPFRYWSSKTGHQHSSPQPEIKPPGKLKAFIVRKYVHYLTQFDTTFERHYPKIYQVYRLFKDGIRDFFNDTTTYYSVATDIWSGKPLDSFSRRQLEIYRQMPSDMLRSAPVVLAIPLPFVPYILCPIAYMFPRHLLCRHFWTPQQRLDFALHDLRNHRLPQYLKILAYMEAHSASIRDTGRRKVFADILFKISNNIHPEVDAILDVRELFSNYPFGMEHLLRRHKIHLWHLCRGIGFSTRPSRLQQDLTLQHHIDLAIHHEGVNSLSLPELQQACFSRGLNAIDVDEQDLRHYLSMWTRIASSIDESSLSLLLHSPVLLSTTWPSNAKYLTIEPQP